MWFVPQQRNAHPLSKKRGCMQTESVGLSVITEINGTCCHFTKSKYQPRDKTEASMRQPTSTVCIDCPQKVIFSLLFSLYNTQTQQNTIKVVIDASNCKSQHDKAIWCLLTRINTVFTPPHCDFWTRRARPVPVEHTHSAASTAPTARWATCVSHKDFDGRFSSTKQRIISRTARSSDAQDDINLSIHRPRDTAPSRMQAINDRCPISFRSGISFQNPFWHVYITTTKAILLFAGKQAPNPLSALQLFNRTLRRFQLCTPLHFPRCIKIGSLRLIFEGCYCGRGE